MKYNEHRIDVVEFSDDEAFVTGAKDSKFDLEHLDGIDNSSTK